jgi:ribulose-phosphate 3-epimerase
MDKTDAPANGKRNDATSDAPRSGAGAPRIMIAPSILSADFARLAEEIQAAETAGADIIHVDVMDGRFVPNITIGPVVVEKVRKITRLPIDVHLMIEEPGRFAADFIKAGADYLVVHVEACPHLHRNIQQIRELSEKIPAKDTGRACGAVVPGVALNPHTPISSVMGIMADLGLVMIMTVNPGFGGQKFIHSCLKKIEDARSVINKLGLDIPIEVDGGINPNTASLTAKAGARILVAGAAVFCSQDYPAAIEAIRQAALSK